MTTYDNTVDQSLKGSVADTRLNRQKIIDENWVDRYLLGKLSESDAMAFEDYYAGCTETLQELEEATLLIDGLQQAPEGIVSISQSREQQTTPAPQPSRSMRWQGIAAAFVAGAFAVFGSGQLMQVAGGGEDAQLMAAVNPDIVMLSPSRGGERGIVVERNTDQAPVFLSLDVGYDVAARYSATVTNGSGTIIFESDALRPDASQLLNIMLDRRLLPAGAYQIEVQPVDSSDDALRFDFTTE